MRNEARAAFLVGVAVRDSSIVEERTAVEYRISYPPTKASDAGYIDVSNDLDDVSMTLIRRRLDAHLKDKIDQYNARHAGPAQLFEMLKQFIRPRADGLPARAHERFTEGGKRLTAEEVEAYLQEYVERNQELAAMWNDEFKDPGATRCRLADPEGKMAYGCRQCNQVLAYTLADFRRITRKGGGFTCPICNRLPYSEE
jgi:hypothetical protein